MPTPRRLVNKKWPAQILGEGCGRNLETRNQGGKEKEILDAVTSSTLHSENCRVVSSIRFAPEDGRHCVSIIR